MATAVDNPQETYWQRAKEFYHKYESEIKAAGLIILIVALIIVMHHKKSNQPALVSAPVPPSEPPAKPPPDRIATPYGGRA